jgi:thioredoxin-dependent peroxiredoxin
MFFLVTNLQPKGCSLITLAMKYLIFVILFSVSFKINAQPLNTGSKVPEFKLLDQNGKIFDIKDVLGKQKLVIYFYPKDDTPGCTKEACTFRDQFEVFKQTDAMIIGISGQSVESHKQFAEKYKLPFTLLSDLGNKIRKLFGVTTEPIPGRVTFVVDKNGTIAYVFNSLSEPEKHVAEALRILKGMN